MKNKKPNISHFTSILIVDDHPLIRSGLVQAVQSNSEFKVIGEAESIESAKTLTKQFEPRVILLDLSLEDGSGFEFLDWQQKNYPAFHVLVISMFEDSAYIKKAFQCGAKGYLFKRDSINHVSAAIQRILQGKRYTSEAASERLLDGFSHPQEQSDVQPDQILTKREYEVYLLLGKGMSRKEIAAKLSVSPNTVESHIERMKIKLNVTTSSQLIYMAIKQSEPNSSS